jgi:hypothetical protein
MQLKTALALFLLTGLFTMSVNANTFELKSDCYGTLFWRSTPGFVQKQLTSMGKDKDASRILMKFDLKKIPVNKFDTIKKAVIRLNAASVKNSGKLSTKIVIINSDWNEADVAWNHDCWPKVTKASEKGNFECAWNPKSGVGTVIKKTGKIEFDVTSIIRRRLFMGKKNYGFALVTGKQCFESETKGEWDIKFKDAPELILETTGSGPVATEKDIARRTLRFYPSATLPPVAKPYIFLWCAFSGRERQKLFWNKFKTMNVDGVYDDEARTKRGILGLRQRQGPAKWYRAKSAKKIERYYYAPREENNNYGIAIDEWQMKTNRFRPESTGTRKIFYPKGVDYAIEAIKQIKKKDPSYYVAVYWRGEGSMKPLAKYGCPDLVLPEVYTWFPKHNNWAMDKEGVVRMMKWAKKDGFVNRAVPLFGCLYTKRAFPKEKKEPTVAQVEKLIVYTRKNWPQAAGAGFYVWYNGKGQSKEEKLARVKDIMPLAVGLDKLLYKHYVKPAPKVVFVRPKSGAKISSAKVLVKAKAKCKGSRKIIKYRWFIDNRLMAETKKNKWYMDTRGEKAGNHLITVHAIDSRWNRAAKQIMIKIVK